MRSKSKSKTAFQKVKTNLYKLNKSMYEFIKEWHFFRIDINEELSKSQKDVFRSISSIFEKLFPKIENFGITGNSFAISPEELYDSNKKDITQEVLNRIKEQLSSELQIDSDSIQIVHYEKEELFEFESNITLIRLIIGHQIKKMLEDKGCEFIRSIRGGGRYGLKDIEDYNRRKAGKVDWILDFSPYGHIERVIDIGIIGDKKDFKSIFEETQNKHADIYASIELKTIIIGKVSIAQRLEVLLNNPHYRKLRTSYQDLDHNQQLKEEFLSKLNTKNPKYKTMIKNMEDSLNAIAFYLKGFKYDPSLMTRTILYKFGFKNREITAKQQLTELGFSENEIKKIQQDSKNLLAELKPRIKGKNIDPNKKFYLPISLLFESISQDFLKDLNKMRDYTRFSSIKHKLRSDALDFLIETLGLMGNVLEEKVLLNTDNIEYESKKIKERVFSSERDYTSSPRTERIGFEDLGELSKIFIVNTDNRLSFSNLKYFKKLFKDAFREIEKYTNKKPNKSVEIRYINGTIRRPEDLANRIEDDPSIALLVIGNSSKTWADFKRFFTVKRGQPVQYLKVKTCQNITNGRGRARAIISNLIKQLVAKAGGLVYKLEPIMDNAVIIGLDRARDPFGKALSASAGVAAFTSEGYYLGGASSKIDKESHDFINAEEIAPKLLSTIEKKVKPEYLIILRDGDPKIAEHEVKVWKDYCEKNNIKLIYVASRKTHPLRIYPVGESDGNREYRYPLAIKHLPTDERDFMTLNIGTHQGTPKPVLYTIMENDSDLDLEQIKDKLIKLIVDFSQLCWESTTSTGQPMPLHYADKLAEFTKETNTPWDESNNKPMFI
ncbi:MAG: Piwi domain-containing protein [Promethearchaeota archaeon]